MESRCTVDACERPYYAKSLCKAHYGRLRRAGTVEPTRPQTCSVEGCDRKHSARGWCLHHYDRWRYYGDPLYVRQAKAEHCSVDGCDRKRHVHGLCALHYNRKLRTGEIGPAGTIYRYGATCAVDGCDRSHWGKGWCETHFRRWKQYGDPLIDRSRGWNMKPGAPAKNRPAAQKRRVPESWRQVHSHLNRHKGSASAHSCVKCGGQAREWAYDNADPDVRFDEVVGMAYSIDLEKHYQPMCSPCHKKFDNDHRRALLGFLVARVIHLEAMLPTVRKVV